MFYKSLLIASIILATIPLTALTFDKVVRVPHKQIGKITYYGYNYFPHEISEAIEIVTHENGTIIQGELIKYRKPLLTGSTQKISNQLDKARSEQYLEVIKKQLNRNASKS